jgi:hypothetical protein
MAGVLPSMDAMAGVDKNAAAHQLLQMAALLLNRADFVENPPLSPAERLGTTLETRSTPERAATEAPDAPATASAPTRRRRCPDLLPFIREATQPVGVRDLQKAISEKTGAAPCLATIQTHIWKLERDGIIEVSAVDRRGNVIPYPRDRRTTYQICVAVREAESTGRDAAPLSAPAESCSEPGSDPAVTEDARSNLAPSSSPTADSESAPPGPVAAMPMAPDDLVRTLREVGGRVTIHIEF